MTEYLSVDEVADKFSVSAKTIKRLVARQRIPFVRIGVQLRFPALMLDDWARDPDLVASRWFAAKEAAGKREKEENVSDPTEGEELGRSLFLHGCSRKEAGILQGRVRGKGSR